MPAIPEDVQAKAGKIQDDFNTTVRAIRSNGDLTQEARLRRLAQAQAEAQRAMEDVKASWLGTSTDTAETLTKRIFGSSGMAGADAISARDAADRASRVETAGEAASLLEMAENNGDEVLARAVAMHAFGMRHDILSGDWGSIVDAYASTRPDVAEQIVELANVQRDTVMTNVAAAFVFSIHTPPELDSLTGTQVRALVDGAPSRQWDPWGTAHG
ncbi:MAG TPA: hypothetical protein VGK78_14690 [Nocardioides sp.]|uniref:hypothetical protein n=1 Tax=Nocardioides sp. TaxID=35761 RepID=UPI002F42BBEC